MLKELGFTIFGPDMRQFVSNDLDTYFPSIVRFILVVSGFAGRVGGLLIVPNCYGVALLPHPLPSLLLSFPTCLPFSIFGCSYKLELLPILS